MSMPLSLVRLLGLAVGLAIGMVGAGAAQAAPVDWSLEVARAALTNEQGKPFSGASRAWHYTQGFYLHGIGLVYERTRDPRLLTHLKQWGARHVEPDGRIVQAPGGASVDLSTLDNLMPGRVLLQLWRLTGEQRYRLAAETIRQRLKDWPRTMDGAFWHRDDPNSRFASNVIWADGTFMFAPFLVEYGRLFPADGTTGRDEAARQMEIYGRHLQDPETGLIWHAYDQDRDFAWARLPAPRHSPVLWCRAAGWYGLSLVAVLEALPQGHPHRTALLNRLVSLMKGYRAHQSATEYGWRQVMDGPDVIQTAGGPLANFVETSCSAMHSYVIGRAVAAFGLRLPDFHLAAMGLQAVTEQVSLNFVPETGIFRATLAGAVRGTGIGAGPADYLNSASIVDDALQGLGAFLAMYESSLRQPPPGSVRIHVQAEAGKVTAPLHMVAFPNQAGVTLVAAPAGTNSLASVAAAGRDLIHIQLAKAGKYRLWGRFLAPSLARNSLWVRVDAGSWQLWDARPHGETLFWEPLRTGIGYARLVVLALAAGPHTIELANREGGTGIDRVLLTSAPTYVPDRSD